LEPTTWRLAAPRATDWRAWDDEIVVFHQTTGSTHHLSAFGSAVLMALLDHPSGLDVRALVRALESRADHDDRSSLAEDVRAALTTLAELKLVESVTA
jgi:PqqD family protein of HPr-rel-A system